MEKKGVGRPRDGNPEETRQEILRAAAEAFAACGFVGATTRAVAARAGVNVATLHYHFGSKEGLYRAVLGNACRGTLPAVPPGTGAETVAGLVEGLFAFGAQRPTLARLALLDALAGPGPRGGEPDARVRWFAETLRPLLAPANGRPAPDAGTGRTVGRRPRRRDVRRRTRAGTGSPLRPFRARRYRSRAGASGRDGPRRRRRGGAPPQPVSSERGRPVPGASRGPARRTSAFTAVPARTGSGPHPETLAATAAPPPRSIDAPATPDRTERRGTKARSVGRISPDAKMV